MYHVRSDASAKSKEGLRSESAQSSGSTDVPLTPSPFSRSLTPAEAPEMERRSSWEVSMGKDGGFTGPMVDFVRTLRANSKPGFRRSLTAPLRTAPASPAATRQRSPSPSMSIPSPEVVVVAPAAAEEDMSLTQRETAQTEGLPPLVRTQRWTWTATTLKSAGKKLRPPARPAADLYDARTWSMLKQQRTKPQPALPESEWARQVYRRHAFLKAQGAEEGTLAAHSPSGHEVTSPVQIIRSGSARSSRRSSQEQGSDMGPPVERSRGTLYSSPLLTTSSASARESEEEEEANPENSGPLRSRALDRMSRTTSSGLRKLASRVAYVEL
eukprot:s6894_g1.t1